MTDIEQIKGFYEQAVRSFKPEAELSSIEISFYPYVGINHTIRVRGGKIFVRIAEIFKEAPLEIQKALAIILVAKLFRKKIPAQISNLYRSFVKTEDIQTKAVENKRKKGRKLVSTAKGEIYDLEEIFFRLNRIYFHNSIQKPILTWSQKKTFRILGHHDSTHETIVISKSLDDKKVPSYVVEFVVFHEMLHVFHPTIHHNNRRYNHTPRFRADEKKFAHFEEAENWIQNNAKNLKRRARGK